MVADNHKAPFRHERECFRCSNDLIRFRTFQNGPVQVFQPFRQKLIAQRFQSGLLQMLFFSFEQKDGRDFSLRKELVKILAIHIYKPPASGSDRKGSTVNDPSEK